MLGSRILETRIRRLKPQNDKVQMITSDKARSLQAMEKLAEKLEVDAICPFLLVLGKRLELRKI